MPARYESMRDKFYREFLKELLAKGMSREKAEKEALKRAKTKAVRIFNATRKRGEAPVTGKHD